MIDDISMKILKILQNKARIPNVEVARQVGLVPSAVLERIRKLEKQGYIDGYEVRLNPKRFKRGLIAFVILYIEPASEFKKINKKLTSMEEIQEMHHITGEDGYLLKVRVADTNELGILISRIGSMPRVKNTKTMTVMSTVKETARIPIEAKEEGRKRLINDKN